MRPVATATARTARRLQTTSGKLGKPTQTQTQTPHGEGRSTPSSDSDGKLTPPTQTPRDTRGKGGLTPSPAQSPDPGDKHTQSPRVPVPIGISSKLTFAESFRQYAEQQSRDGKPLFGSSPPDELKLYNELNGM